MNALPEGVVVGADWKPRCWWALLDPDFVSYHDQEWGRPVDDDVTLFERFSLESFASGLSWLTILRKREGFREVFQGFDPEVVARYSSENVAELLGDNRIVRHRGKIEATISNAGVLLDIWDAGDTLKDIVDDYSPDPRSRPGLLDQSTLLSLSATEESVALSKELKRRGWRFMGPRTTYAAMQAAGVVNDHLEGCFAREHLMRAAPQAVL